ncbi:MAG TPA: LysE family translocator [Acidimicrobiales bacterium]|nr:LysE family translocator [Acidimicrobiales bacterium]
MSPERQIRLLVRLFPDEWRRRHEDALVGTVLDGMGPRSRILPLGEVLDLCRAAVTVRRRTADTSARRQAIAVVALAAVVVAVAALVSPVGGRLVSAEFLATSLVVVLVPGTGVVYTVASALAGGWRRGILAAVGCTLGIVPHLAAALLGLSGVMHAGALAFEVVRWAGVAYLTYIGLSMLRGRSTAAFGAEPADEPGSDAEVIRRGVVLNVLNPKLTVFFFAFLPQFLDSAPVLLDPRLVTLAGVFMAMTLAVFAGYAWLSAAVREQVLRSPRLVDGAQRALGAAMVTFAARLATTDR